MFDQFIEPSAELIERMRVALARALSVPIIGDVDGFVWERVFQYAHAIQVSQRSKKLFDVVDAAGRGWSLKTLEWNGRASGTPVEYVTQRADLYGKGPQLGFRGGLTEASSVEVLGEALVEHWNQKHRADSQAQRVTEPFIALLLKSADRHTFTYIEGKYPGWSNDGLTWSWVNRPDGRRVGLRGAREGRTVLKWYPSGKQLFEVLRIPAEAVTFHIDWWPSDLTDWFEQLAPA